MSETSKRPNVQTSKTKKAQTSKSPNVKKSKQAKKKGATLACFWWLTLLLGLLGFSAVGCKSGNADWTVDHGDVEPGLTFRWGMVGYLGVPGHLSGHAAGKGQLKEAPPANASTEIDSAQAEISESGQQTPNKTPAP
jgi:hypothetical protein